MMKYEWITSDFIIIKFRLLKNNTENRILFQNVFLFNVLDVLSNLRIVT